LIENNIISGNRADGGGSQGGGIYMADSNPLMVQNLIINNTADQGGGGIYLQTHGEIDISMKAMAAITY
jgi:parallel beta-helix repeat protein